MLLLSQLTIKLSGDFGIRVCCRRTIILLSPEIDHKEEKDDARQQKDFGATSGGKEAPVPPTIRQLFAFRITRKQK